MRTKSLKSLHLGRSIAVTCMSVALLATPTLVDAQNTPNSRKLASEKITLRVSDAPLGTILKQVEQKARIQISIYGAIPGINQKNYIKCPQQNHQKYFGGAARTAWCDHRLR